MYWNCSFLRTVFTFIELSQLHVHIQITRKVISVYETKATKILKVSIDYTFALHIHIEKHWTYLIIN